MVFTERAGNSQAHRLWRESDRLNNGNSSASLCSKVRTLKTLEKDKRKDKVGHNSQVAVPVESFYRQASCSPNLK
jgi:hypothetical protein